MYPDTLIDTASMPSAPESLEVQKPNIVSAAEVFAALNVPEVVQALAAEGLEVDSEKIQEASDALAAERKAQAEACVNSCVPDSCVPDSCGCVVVPDSIHNLEEANAPVTRLELEQVKASINASFDEIANLLIESQRQIDEINARLDAYNRRGGHRI